MYSFDGKDDHFIVQTTGWKSKEATVFVFARARRNSGGYRGLVSANQTGVNDYASGFTVDLGSKASDAFTALNVEGAGFQR